MENNNFLYSALNIPETVKNWENKHLLDKEEATSIINAWPDKPAYSLLKRLGIYIASLIVIAISSGILSLFSVILLSGFEEGVARFILLFLCISLFVTNHYLITQANLYRKGMDDAARHGGFWFISALFVTNDFPPLVISVIMLIVALTIVRYYADVYLAIIASLLVNMIPLQAIAHAYPELLVFSGVWVIPFNVTVMSWFSRHTNKVELLPWIRCIKAYHYLAPALMFTSVNPLALQAASALFPASHVLPLPDLFLALSALIIVGTFIVGYKTRQKYLLQIPLILCIPLVVSFRYYHALMPASFALLLGGALIFGIARAFLYYLRKHPESGFTSEPEEKNNELKHAELLLQIEQFGVTPDMTKSTTETKGGGQFGGGGSDGNF